MVCFSELGVEVEVFYPHPARPVFPFLLGFAAIESTRPGETAHADEESGRGVNFMASMCGGFLNVGMFCWDVF